MDSILVSSGVSLAKAIVAPIAKKVGEAVGVAAAKVYADVFDGFERYLSNSYKRHSYFSSIVFKNEQKRLVDYYEPLTVRNDLLARDVLVDGYPSDLIDSYERVLIVDSAGMGKTTLLKYVFLRCVEVGKRIPVFVELRKLSRGKGVIDFVVEQLGGVGGGGDVGVIRSLLARGDFIIFLDGYDEISDADRPYVSADVLDLIDKAPLNRFIMTSREESGLASFPSFQRFNIQPLDRKQSYNLLRKYGGRHSGKLIELLDNPEYDGIHEFLVNPLLTSLLYKSYEYKQIVPLKRHIFYRQVFEALFETHDISKEAGYVREKRCGVDIDRFDKLLRSLGVTAYRAGKVEYSKDELLGLVDSAKSLCGEVALASSDVVHDLTHAVPLFVVDGNYFRWSHRSIQEYFAAAYICRDAKAAQVVMLGRLAAPKQVAHHANILSLCADMDPVSFNAVVGGALAEALLNIYDAFERVPGIDDAQQERRARLMVGKKVIIVGRRVSELLGFLHGGDSDADGARHRAIGAINETHEMLKNLVGLDVDGIPYNASIMWNFGNAVSFVPTSEFVVINSLFGKVVFPFVVSHVFLGRKNSILDFDADLLEVDGRTENMLNSKDIFEAVNDLIQALSSWEFDPVAARCFLDSLRKEKDAQVDMSKWLA